MASALGRLQYMAEAFCNAVITGDKLEIDRAAATECGELK
jgi:hypothetical protein